MNRRTSNQSPKPSSPNRRACWPPTKAARRSKAFRPRSASNRPRRTAGVTAKSCYHRGLSSMSAASSFFDETPRARARATAFRSRRCWRARRRSRHQVDKGTRRCCSIPAKNHRRAGWLWLTVWLNTSSSARASPRRRAVIEIDENAIPSTFGIRANAQVLARYAALCQPLDLVPIVEPEVLMDGAHGTSAAKSSPRRSWKPCSPSSTRIVSRLKACRPPNMIIPGKKCPQQASAGSRRCDDPLHEALRPRRRARRRLPPADRAPRRRPTTSTP